MSETPETKRPAWIRSAVDFGALVAFMAAFGILRLRGVTGQEAIIQATWVLMGASAVALLAGWLLEKRLAWLPAIAGGFALVFGALTVFFHDPSIIKIKLTVQNGVLAIVLLGSLLAGKNIGKALLGSAVVMPDEAWRTLTLRYGLYFAACAIANEVVWRTQSDDFWVLTFRPALWITALVFAVANVPFMMKHMKDPDTKDALQEPPDTGM